MTNKPKIVKPTMVQMQKGADRYDKGERPWRTNYNDWQIVMPDNILRPLRYMYGLATDLPPGGYTNKQIEAAMKHLQLPYVQLSQLAKEGRKFELAVRASLADPAARARRLSSASPKPSQYMVVVRAFRRNPDVVAAVLERAAGKCEDCNQAAPFCRVIDGRPYLEVHHRIQLANGGEDTVANALALCPNCHRRAHYGQAPPNVVPKAN